MQSETYINDQAIRAKAQEIAQLCEVLEYARLADDIYNNISSPDEGEEYYVGNWILLKIYDEDSGMKMGVYSKTLSDGTTTYALVSKGTTFTNLDDWAQNLAQPLGESIDMTESIRLAKEFVAEHPDAEIVFVGHSKGGAEAMANAIATNMDAIVFNPANLYHERYDGLDVSSYTGNITSYVVEDEILSTFMDIVTERSTDLSEIGSKYNISDVWNYMCESVPKERLEEELSQYGMSVEQISTLVSYADRILDDADTVLTEEYIPTNTVILEAHFEEGTADDMITRHQLTSVIALIENEMQYDTVA